MTTSSVRPQGLDPAVVRLWRFGDGTGPGDGEDPPVAGDLWLVAETDADFGERDLGMVLVTRVHDGHADVLGVTHADAPAAGVVLDPTILGTRLVVWTDQPATVEFTTLSRRLGALVEAFTLARLLAHASDDRTGSDGDGRDDGVAESRRDLIAFLDAIAAPASLVS